MAAHVALSYMYTHIHVHFLNKSKLVHCAPVTVVAVEKSRREVAATNPTFISCGFQGNGDFMETRREIRPEFVQSVTLQSAIDR